MALSSLFFYPLSSTLSDSSYYLHWRETNSWEFLIAWLLMSIPFAVAAGFAFSERNTKVRLLVALSVSIIPLASFSIQIARRLKMAAFIIQHQDDILLKAGLLFLLLFLAFVLIHPRLDSFRKKFLNLLFVLLLVLSPLSLSVIYTLLRATIPFLSPASNVSDDRPVPAPESDGMKPEGDIYVIVFDTMSYEYLYKESIVRASYPNIKSFSAAADNFRAAIAPGPVTEYSMPPLVLGKKEMKTKVQGPNLHQVDESGALLPLTVSSDCLFWEAKSRGYRTVLYGWFLQYCKLLGENLDDCASYSGYNYSGPQDSFSVINPVLTTFILWPHYQPFGLARNPFEGNLHRKSVNKTFKKALKAMSADHCSFVFLHFGIPHWPFVFDASGFNPGPDPSGLSGKNYAKQLEYVDRLFGLLLDGMISMKKYDASAIILMADHNFLLVEKATKMRRIPLILKRRHQNERRDIHEAAHAVDVIREVILGGAEGGHN